MPNSKKTLFLSSRDNKEVLPFFLRFKILIRMHAKTYRLFHIYIKSLLYSNTKSERFKKKHRNSPIR